MKKILNALLVCFFLIVTLGNTQIKADEYYDINSYDVNVVVNDDNTYDIVETIEVQFHSDRHGIYREIPTNHNGRSHRLKNIDVYNPNNMEPYTIDISGDSNETVIKIGDADTYVSGVITYAIAYTYDWGMDYNQDMDEFYYNIIGTQWDSVINSVTFTVDMPNDFDGSVLNITSGSLGSTNTGNVSYMVSGTSISGYTLEPLMPFEGLTLALPLPEGYYTEVDKNINMLFFYILIALMAVIAFYGKMKNSHYKNKNLIVPVVTFEPPYKLNPAEVAYIFGRETLAIKDLATLILQWAAQGHLTITEDKKLIGASDMTFIKTSELSPDAKAYEKALFKSMFGYGDGTTVTTKDMRYKFYNALSAAYYKLKKTFTKDQEILINSVQILTKVFGVLVLIVGALGSAYLSSLVMKTQFIGNFVMALIFSGLLGVVLVLIKSTFNSSLLGKQRVLTGFLTIVMSFIALSLFMLNFYDLTMILKWNSNFSFYSFFIYYILIAFAFSSVFTIQSYTDFGKDTLGKIEGFRNFLNTAKKDQLEMLYAQNPTYFYDILPYAMALGLTGIWANHVEKLAVEAPNWYNSSAPFNAAMFTHSMTRSFANASAPKPQSNSGSSSGGGFSGGGGGGGGGGSW